jgi:alkyl hydroperoxide reductase subunit AhpC
LSSFCLADTLGINSTAPYFKVVSGNNEELTLDDIKGKVVIIFYETEATAERNRKLKNKLNEFYDAQPDSVKKVILRLPVINCAGVFFTGAWKNELKERSKMEGITIYGDWDGKMSCAYSIKDKESNLVIIDKNGIIKYHSAGKVGDKDIEIIKDLLALLANEKLKSK